MYLHMILVISKVQFLTLGFGTLNFTQKLIFSVVLRTSPVHTAQLNFEGFFGKPVNRHQLNQSIG